SCHRHDWPKDGSKSPTRGEGGSWGSAGDNKHGVGVCPSYPSPSRGGGLLGELCGWGSGAECTGSRLKAGMTVGWGDGGYLQGCWRPRWWSVLRAGGGAVSCLTPT